MISRKNILKAVIGGALLTAATVTGASADKTAAPVSSDFVKFQLDYTGSLFFFTMGTLSFRGEKNAYGYSVRADMESAGLGKLSKDGGLWSTTTGYYDAAGVHPKRHEIQKLNSKARNVTMEYDASGLPTSTIKPRFGSMGVPPATDAERREAVDAISGIMQMMMTGHAFGDEPCQGTIKIFDGKQRYNLNMRKVGNNYIRQSSYSGETTRCNVMMENVSGYDPEDRLTAEEAATPLTVYLANFEGAGFWVPVRFDYRVSGIRVNIKATNIAFE